MVDLIEAGVDVLTTHAAGRNGRPEDEQLTFATQAERVMVTLDADYLILAAQGIAHAGIAYAKRGTHALYRSINPELKLIHDVLTVADMEHHVEYL